jgi:hypothetical protein
VEGRDRLGVVEVEDGEKGETWAVSVYIYTHTHARTHTHAYIYIRPIYMYVCMCVCVRVIFVKVSVEWDNGISHIHYAGADGSYNLESAGGERRIPQQVMCA